MFSMPIKTSIARKRRNQPWNQREISSLQVFATLHSTGMGMGTEKLSWDLAAKEVGRSAYECKERAHHFMSAHPAGHAGWSWRPASLHEWDSEVPATEMEPKGGGEKREEDVSDAALQDALWRRLSAYINPQLTLVANERWTDMGLRPFTHQDDGANHPLPRQVYSKP